MSEEIIADIISDVDVGNQTGILVPYLQKASHVVYLSMRCLLWDIIISGMI